MRFPAKTAFFLPLLLVASLSLFPSSATQADDILPQPVQAEIKTPLAKVGSGTYRKYGFRIYNATLWAPGGLWDSGKPYALELHYTRSLSKGTVIDAVTDDIRDQNVADEETLTRWGKMLDDALPAIEEDDVLIGLHVPGRKSQLFYNGKSIANIDDPAFSTAFFNIWLGAGADEDLRARLLGHTP